jgi:hypothetical protein
MAQIVACEPVSSPRCLGRWPRDGRARQRRMWGAASLPVGLVRPSSFPVSFRASGGVPWCPLVLAGSLVLGASWLVFSIVLMGNGSGMCPGVSVSGVRTAPDDHLWKCGKIGLTPAVGWAVTVRASDSPLTRGRRPWRLWGCSPQTLGRGTAAPCTPGSYRPSGGRGSRPWPQLGGSSPKTPANSPTPFPSVMGRGRGVGLNKKGAVSRDQGPAGLLEPWLS